MNWVASPTFGATDQINAGGSRSSTSSILSPSASAGKRAGQIAQTVAKSPGVQNQMSRNSRSVRARSQTEAASEVQVPAQARHGLEIGDILAEGHLHSGSVDDRLRDADRMK